MNDPLNLLDREIPAMQHLEDFILSSSQTKTSKDGKCFIQSIVNDISHNNFWENAKLGGISHRSVFIKDFRWDRKAAKCT